jgi:hypothetical protein
MVLRPTQGTRGPGYVPIVLRFKKFPEGEVQPASLKGAIQKILIILYCRLQGTKGGNHMAQTNLEKKDRKKDSNTRKVKDFFSQVKDQAQSMSSSTIIYILLATGLILLLAWPFIGGAIIGLVAGYLFSNEIINRAKTIKDAIEHEEVTRGVVLGVVLVAFLLVAPGIVLGATVSTIIKRLVGDRSSNKH